ncbi:Calpain-6 [Rhizophlyctis rosea]|nr:Calpain-6 [Rhizophlyctis rosea]
MPSFFFPPKGNVPETINLRSPTTKHEFSNTSLYTFMQKHVNKKDTLMSCCIVPGAENDGDANLHPRLTYTITQIFTIKIRMSNMRRRTVQLVKLRSPWGVVKFQGAWSLLSAAVPKREMRRLGLVDEVGGEFVMSFEDFLRNFTILTICRLHHTPSPITPSTLLSRHTKFEFQSAWSVHANTAGGSLNHPSTFCANPQFLIIAEETCEVLVSLMQGECAVGEKSFTVLEEDTTLSEEDTWNTTMGIFSPTSSSYFTPPPSSTLAPPVAPPTTPYHPTGLALLRIESNRKYRLHTPEGYAILHQTPHTPARDIFTRIRIPARGRYVLVVSTFSPGMEGKFLLRAVTKPKGGACITPLVKHRPVEHRTILPNFGSLSRSSGKDECTSSTVLDVPKPLLAMRKSKYPIGCLKIEVVSLHDVVVGERWGALGKAVPYVDVVFSELGGRVFSTGLPVSDDVAAVLSGGGGGEIRGWNGEGKKGRKGVVRQSVPTTTTTTTTTTTMARLSMQSFSKTPSPVLKPVFKIETEGATKRSSTVGVLATPTVAASTNRLSHPSSSSSSSTTSTSTTSSTSTLTSPPTTTTCKFHTQLLFPTHDPFTATMTLTVRSRMALVPVGDSVVGSVVLGVGEWCGGGREGRTWDVRVGVVGEEKGEGGKGRGAQQW